MILLTAITPRALPALPTETPYRRLILPRQRDQGERALRGALAAGHYDRVISSGFAVAADHRLEPADLLLATRVFGGADLYLDLPAYQAPGAVMGSLLTFSPADEEQQPVLGRKPRPRPSVYAIDDHAFWLARVAQAAGVPALVVRAIMAPAAARRRAEQAIATRVALTPFTLARQTIRARGRIQAILDLLRTAGQCRSNLAATLSILLVLHTQPA